MRADAVNAVPNHLKICVEEGIALVACRASSVAEPCCGMSSQTFLAGPKPPSPVSRAGPKAFAF